jgi:poly(hydroxyalkanoate) depolymerase family esterase
MLDQTGRARDGRGEPPPAAVARRRRGRARLLCAALTGAAAAAVLVATAIVPAAAPAAGGTLTSGSYPGAGGSLHYELFVPSRATRDEPMPLVVALHGCTQTADGFRKLTHWDAEGEAKGFAVVFPEQDSSANSLRCWNFFQPGSMQRGGGEAERIAGLTRSIAERYAIDRRRVYVTGLSAGGAMASVMGATYPDLFAAIGVGSGCEYAATAACAGDKSADPVQAGRSAYQAMGSYARPMPFIAFQGDADGTVPPVNADQLVQQWLVTNDLADDGALNDSVPGESSNLAHGTSAGGRAYTVRSYVNRGGGALGEYWVVHGMAHAWSGGDASQPYADPSGPDETASMYAFFASHPAP